MSIKCLQCDAVELQEGRVKLNGSIRGESYTVEMDGLVCPRCAYQTLEGPEMAEYRRLLADEYRKAHGLLTSEQIRARRAALSMTQERFARHLGVGIASVKRWEMGKIQDQRSNELIIERTTPVVEAVPQYTVHVSGCNSTMYIGSSVSCIGNRLSAEDYDAIEEALRDFAWNPCGSRLDTNGCLKRFVCFTDSVPNIPPYIIDRRYRHKGSHRGR